MKNNTERSVILKPNQKGLEFYADRRAAGKFMDLLIHRLEVRGVPYHAAHVPQAEQFLPKTLERGSAQHAIFLFMLCLWMRGGNESDTAADWLAKLYDARPELFDPEAFAANDAESTRNQINAISLALIQYRLGQKVNENGVGWVYNLRKLGKFWNGDPRLLLHDKPSFKKMVGRIKSKSQKSGGSWEYENDPNGFMFFREKMVSMLAYFLMDMGLVPLFVTPVPVDFHVLRLMVSNGAIRVKGKSVEESVGIDFAVNGNLGLIRDLTVWYCRTRKVSPVALCDALWLLSRNLCRYNPGNSGRVHDNRRRFKDQDVFPVPPPLGLDSSVNIGPLPPSEERIIKKGRKRYEGLKWGEKELFADERRIRRFEKSCGRCPLNKTCQYDISAGAYYVGGRLLPERLRVVPKRKVYQLEFNGEFGDLHPPVDPTVRFAEIRMPN